MNKSIRIAETTREEREQIVAESLRDDESPKPGMQHKSKPPPVIHSAEASQSSVSKHCALYVFSACAASRKRPCFFFPPAFSRRQLFNTERKEGLTGALERLLHWPSVKVNVLIPSSVPMISSSVFHSMFMG